MNDVTYKTIDLLQGKTFVNITRDDLFSDERLTFVTADGERIMMYHQANCCETVKIEDIVGDLDDLVGTPNLTCRRGYKG